ncbi:MAG: hypothetical protein KatS3mg015_1048 [Fimbriimonadales bacterium]|nr:MAG: hypothetical protein KatS3mg015_1048 [Fimbriimonadales bacterium]
MAGEGGSRHYWPKVQNVNVASGNLHLVLGPGSCVTCGGVGSGPVYPSPDDSRLHGPVFVFNSMGTAETTLGPKWMRPYDTYLTVAGNGDVTLIDADGTERFYQKTNGTYSARKERDKLSKVGSEYILTRFNGTKWIYDDTTGLLMKITSRTGREITITRDGSNNITKVTDGFGRETQYFYMTIDGKTLLNEIREPAPDAPGWYSTLVQYDTSERLSQITNAIGETQRFEYDSAGRLSRAINGHGDATEFSYDTGGRVTGVKDAAQNTTVIAYTSATLRTVTDRLNNAWEYHFDSSNRITKIVDPLGNETEYAYDANSWELVQQDLPKINPSGAWRRLRLLYTYGTSVDTEHELLKTERQEITSSTSGVAEPTLITTYNALHDPLTQEDGEGNLTALTYEQDSGGNSVGLVKTITNGEGETVVTNTYDTAANFYRLLKTKNGVNKETTFAYNQNSSDSYGIPDRITLPTGATFNKKVDVRGRIIEEWGPSGNRTKFFYDALDRLIRTEFADGTVMGVIFDCCHMVADYDQNGHGNTYEYDVMGRLVKILDPNGEAITMEYDAESNLIKETDARGNETQFSYDASGRQTQIDYPGGYQVVLTYWEPGMVKSKTNRKGTAESVVNYEYDEFNRLKKRVFASQPDVEFTYYKNDLRKTMKDASGEKRYYYDMAQRLTKVEQGPQGFVVGTDHRYVLEYVWDAASQVTQKKVTLRGMSAKTWNLTYTDDGYLDQVVNPDGEATKHEYLSDGRLKKITLRATELSNKATRELFYEDTDNNHAYVSGKMPYVRRTLDKKESGAVITDFEYELDKAGLRLSMKDKDGKYWAFTYDPRYQLRSETKWSQKVNGSRLYQYGWLYDPNGNRLVQHHDGVPTDYSYGLNNEMLEAGSVDFTYDHFGNTKTKVEGGNTTTYSWDDEGHLLGVDYPGTTNDDSHEYDGDGKRMRSKLAGATEWREFVYDELSGEILMEYTLVGGTFAVKAVNTWGLGLISSNREGVKRYFHFDALGSTRALTDSTGSVTDTYEYNAFGVLESSTGSSTNPYRYVGQWGYYDDGAMGSSSGLLLTASGYYSPTYGELWAGLAGGAVPGAGGLGALFDACVAFFCSGKQTAEMVRGVSGLEGTRKALWDWIKDRLLDRILEELKIDPGAMKDCYEDGRREHPRTVLGRLIRAACLWLADDRIGARTCKKTNPDPDQEASCLACCDTLFGGQEEGSYRWRLWNKCKEYCHGT